MRGFLSGGFTSGKAKEQEFAMPIQPKCVIVTGRAGAGKTTLSKKLGGQLWMPVISRDEIKEGYVNTFGLKHDQLPAQTNGVVTDFFFRIVGQYLANQISVVIEAAFQHHIWATRITALEQLSRPIFIICDVGAETAASRHLQRGLNDANREFYHGDKRVSIYKETGAIAPAGDYQAPQFDIPTLHVATDDEYTPSIAEIVRFVRNS